MHSPVVVGTAVLAATAAVTFYGTTRAQGSDGAGTLRFYEHDTQQANKYHGDPGASPGDEFIFSGDLFDHQGGRKVGRLAGHCATMSGGSAGAEEVLCSAGFVLEGRQIITEGVFDHKAVFSRGETVAFTVTGGTGLYRGARGEGTVQVPVDVPNQTDANFVLHLSRGD